MVAAHDLGRLEDNTNGAACGAERRMSTELAINNSNSTSRTTVRFTAPENMLRTVAAWAEQHGYRPQQQGDGRHVFQKGTGFLVAPMMVELVTDGDQVTLTAWVRINLFTRIMSFFLLPAEMPVQSGGFRAVIPRNMARKAVNALLTDLAQPLIP